MAHQEREGDRYIYQERERPFNRGCWSIVTKINTKMLPRVLQHGVVVMFNAPQMGPSHDPHPIRVKINGGDLTFHSILCFTTLSTNNKSNVKSHTEIFVIFFSIFYIRPFKLTHWEPLNTIILPNCGATKALNKHPMVPPRWMTHASKKLFISII